MEESESRWKDDETRSEREGEGGRADGKERRARAGSESCGCTGSPV